MSDVEITRLPSTDGQTQERRIGVEVTADDDVLTDETGSVELRIDADHDDEFRTLDTNEVYFTSSTVTTTFNTLIDASAPYTLEAVAMLPTPLGHDLIRDEAEVITTVQTGPDEGDEVYESLTEATARPIEDVRPRIADVEPITMRAEYELPWERQSNQTACGVTLQNQAGDKNWRVTIEGIITVNQLRELDALRGSDSVEVVTAEFGSINIAFDNLVVTRTDEQKVGKFRDELGPLLQFQLQVKEEEGEGIEFFDENTRGTPQDDS